jgi:Tfp pilus assembly protein PilO
MSTSNTPLATIETQPKKNYKNAIIATLAVALVATGGFLAYDRSDKASRIDQQQTQIATVTTEKSNLQSSFDASLARLDSMGTVTNGLNAELTTKNAEIAKAKEEIRSILNKKNATAAELSKAKNMIASLNGKITTMEQEIAKLTEDNRLLGEEKVALIADKDKLTMDLTTTTGIKQELEKKVDIASTLNASNIVITPVNVKRNGKEKVSSTAKRVDKMVVSFDVANRIIQPGSTDLYVLVIGPDGQAITSGPATGLFTTREEGDKTYTAKVPVDLETAKTKNVAFSFAPGATFQQGNYKIQIYQNGFLIGQGTKALKKGGLFS